MCNEFQGSSVGVLYLQKRYSLWNISAIQGQWMWSFITFVRQTGKIKVPLMEAVKSVKTQIENDWNINILHYSVSWKGAIEAAIKEKGLQHTGIEEEKDPWCNLKRSISGTAAREIRQKRNPPSGKQPESDNCSKSCRLRRLTCSKRYTVLSSGLLWGLNVNGSMCVAHE